MKKAGIFITILALLTLVISSTIVLVQITRRTRLPLVTRVRNARNA